MMLLVDTHILLAVLGQETSRLPRVQAEVLLEKKEGFTASVASIWEVAIKHRLGKLALSFDLADLPQLLEDAGIGVLPITIEHVIAEIDPVPVTRDPFDRLLLAQCAVDRMRLVTIDRALADHPLAARV